MSDQMHVWTTTYKTVFRPSPGKVVSQDVVELLIATPAAILKYKVVYNPKSTRIYTDVQAQSKDWFTDVVRKVKTHPYYKGMAFHARNNGARIDLLACGNVAALEKQTNIQEIIKGDEKACNAFALAMGVKLGPSFDDIAKAAEVKTKEMRVAALEEDCKMKMHADELWGIF